MIIVPLNYGKIGGGFYCLVGQINCSKGSKMKYCPNCGKELNDDVRFCPYCGYKIKEVTKNRSKLPVKKKSLSNRGDETIKDAHTKENILPKREIKKRNNNKLDKKTNNKKSNESEERYIFPQYLLMMYLLVSLLVSLSLLSVNSEDEILGVIIYSLIVLTIAFLRKRTKKPINWLVNIFLILQLVFISILSVGIISYVVSGGQDPYALTVFGLFVLLIFIIIFIILRGNRRVE